MFYFAYVFKRKADELGCSAFWSYLELALKISKLDGIARCSAFSFACLLKRGTDDFTSTTFFPYLTLTLKITNLDEAIKVDIVPS